MGVAMQFSSFLHDVKQVVQQTITQKIMTDKGAKRVYESEDVVEYYFALGALWKPESTILNELRESLPDMRMLDIGVGTGRTTTHFAYLAKEYIGIDYSNEMIKACVKKFQNFPKKISFLAVDARNMKLFNDKSFDFVLFSLNGIDTTDHEERLQILFEIRRIIRPGGYFCFSTHNLNFLLKECSIELSKHPTISAIRTFRLFQKRFLNKRDAWKIARGSSRNQKHIYFNDGAHNFRLKTFYISPVEQLKQLSALGYLDTKLYSLREGSEIENPSNALDYWVYFLSKAA